MDLSPGLSAEGDTGSGVPAAPSILASMGPAGGKGTCPLERGQCANEKTLSRCSYRERKGPHPYRDGG